MTPFSNCGTSVSTKQAIQFGPSPATIEQVAQTGWEALRRWPPHRVYRYPGADHAPPDHETMLDDFLRHISRAYDGRALPLPEGVDDLEAIGEEIQAADHEARASGSQNFRADPKAKFWRQLRRYHEVVSWLRSDEGRECFWIKVENQMPRHGQAVIYYFDVVGAHPGWYFHTEQDHEGTWSSHRGFLGSEVTHWMPLPGPWPAADDLPGE